MTIENYDHKIFNILEEELVPAKGCTEPIAIAFAAAKAREVMGEMPESIIVSASGNLIKNIRCVTVPNTGNLVGIEASAIAGMVAGDSSLGLEVITNISEDDLRIMNQFILKKVVKVKLLETNINLHFLLEARSKTNTVVIEIKDLHTNIVKITKNNKIVFEKEQTNKEYFGVETDRTPEFYSKIINQKSHNG